MQFSSVVKNPYYYYILPSILVLNGHISLQRGSFEDDKSDTALQQFNLALGIHPDFGRVRFLLGGIHLMRQNFLDSIFYYMSSIDSKYPFASDEMLEFAFSSCHQTMNLLKEDKSPNAPVRQFIVRFLCIIGDIWGNVDLDNVISSTQLVISSLSTLLQHNRQINHILCSLQCILNDHWLPFCFV